MAKLQRVLHHGSREVLSLALLRIHGTKMVEMAFIGTLLAYQKQDVTCRLVNVVEQVLASIKRGSQ